MVIYMFRVGFQSIKKKSVMLISPVIVMLILYSVIQCKDMDNSLLVLFFPKHHSLSLIVRKTSDKSNGGTFYKISDQYYSKVSKLSKRRKI